VASCSSAGCAGKQTAEQLREIAATQRLEEPRVDGARRNGDAARIGAEERDLQLFTVRRLAQPSREFDAVHRGHREIGQNQVERLVRGPRRGERLERGRTALHRARGTAERNKQPLDHVAGSAVVVDDQDT
jgi:hypothetical protein